MDEKEMQRRAAAYGRLVAALKNALQEIDALECRANNYEIPDVRPAAHDNGYNLLVELGEANPA